jgi:hypothetical protein
MWGGVFRHYQPQVRGPGVPGIAPFWIAADLVGCWNGCVRFDIPLLARRVRAGLKNNFLPGLTGLPGIFPPISYFKKKKKSISPMNGK